MIENKWVCLSDKPEIQIELFATNVAGVFRTESIKVTCGGVELAMYDHVRVAEAEGMLYIFDLSGKCDVGRLGHFVPLN
jgi:hypothetical protein